MFKYNYDTDSNWDNLLTKFNDKTIIYDEIGKPINIGGDKLTWENGKELASYNNNNYKYNINGIRTQKEVNGIITNYFIKMKPIIIRKIYIMIFQVYIIQIMN